MNGHEKVCDLLLQHGAKVDLLDKVHCTPLHWAVMNGHEKVCHVLLQQGARVEAPDDYQMTPMDSQEWQRKSIL